VSIFGRTFITLPMADIKSSGTGSASTIMSKGNTSGTPSIHMLTVSKPQLAASKVAYDAISLHAMRVGFGQVLNKP
jgi:hypothetical protein